MRLQAGCRAPEPVRPQAPGGVHGTYSFLLPDLAPGAIRELRGPDGPDGPTAPTAPTAKRTSTRALTAAGTASRCLEQRNESHGRETGGGPVGATGRPRRCLLTTGGIWGVGNNGPVSTARASSFLNAAGTMGG
jgi:hypothetical protein